MDIRQKTEKPIGDAAYCYGKTRVEDVWMDETREDLQLTLVDKKHKWFVATYEGVYYNEITQIGTSIILAEQWPLAALRRQLFRPALERFLRECGAPRPELLRHLTERGIRLFVHYSDSRDYIVLARRLEIHARS